MFFGGLWARTLPPYFLQYFQPVGVFFLSFFLSCPLTVRLRALQDLVLFRPGVGGGDWDVYGEGEKRLCCFSFSFCFHCPLGGVGPSLSVVLVACVLS